MENEGSLPHSQAPATCPCPEPHQSSTCPLSPLHEDPSSYYPPIYAWVFQVVSFLQVPYQNRVYTSAPPVRSTYPACLILLDLITRKILGDQFRSLSSSLCSLLHSPVTSSLLGPNITTLCNLSHSHEQHVEGVVLLHST